jgi:multiple sugar transport system permease protein
VKRIAFWMAAFVVLFAFVFPIFWVYLTSFKGKADIYSLEFIKLFLFSPTTFNYHHLFYKTPFFQEIISTAIVSVASTILVMLVALPAAYSFARFNTGYGHLLFITISTRMFPAVVAAIPFFFVFKALGLLDTHFGLTMMYLYFNVSFAVFLLFGFFREIPVELEQAAAIDGYGRLDILRRIVYPLIKPGAAITAVFCLVFAWNEFLFAFLFTRLHAKPVSVGISNFWATIEIQWGPMSAAAGLAILPTLAAAWFMQRYIIRGLTFGAVKG